MNEDVSWIESEWLYSLLIGWQLSMYSTEWEVTSSLLHNNGNDRVVMMDPHHRQPPSRYLPLCVTCEQLFFTVNLEGVVMS